MVLHTERNLVNLDHAVLRDLLTFWNEQRGGARMPVWRRFHTEALFPWMGHLILLDVENAPRRHFVRVFGTHVAAYAGRDITGHYLDAVIPAHAQPTILMPIETCCAECRVVYDLTHLPLAGATTYRLHRLFLPFGRGPGRVEQILEGVYLEAAETEAPTDDPSLTHAGEALP